MGNVDWDPSNCKANNKARLCIDGFVDEVASLKVDQSISTVEFVLPCSTHSFAYCKEFIDSLAELLKVKPNIKTLAVDSTYRHNPRAREYLFQVLAEGVAGDSLEYLWRDDQNGEISVEETGFLARCLTRNNNLTQLRFGVNESQGLEILSTLAGTTTVRELCLDVWPYRGMGELVAALGRCSSILSLKLILYAGDPTEVEFFFRSIPELNCLTRLEISFLYMVPAGIIDALGYFVIQQGTLASFEIERMNGCNVTPPPSLRF